MISLTRRPEPCDEAYCSADVFAWSTLLTGADGLKTDVDENAIIKAMTIKPTNRVKIAVVEKRFCNRSNFPELCGSC